MRDRIIQLLLLLCCLPHLTACIGEEEYANNPQGNFDQLWKIIDEKYCFFDYKQIDWDAIYAEYKDKITPGISNYALFDVLSNMLNELQDGHVNLSSTDLTSSYEAWYQNSPRNFREDIVKEYYLGRTIEHLSTAGMQYKILNDNIGYIRYADFTKSADNGDINEVLSYLSACNGLIIDVRDNGGGNITNSTRLAARFTNKRVLTGFITHKTGKGHNDFSAPSAIYLEPANGVRWQKKVIVLTNCRCYSATNDFVNNMKGLSDKITILGDKTGGGAGLPFTSELPNGWTVRFSASPHFDSEMHQIEWGISPDVMMNMRAEDEANNKDTFIEKARELLKK